MTANLTIDRLPDLTVTMPREKARHLLANTFAAEGLASAELDARILLCAGLGIDHLELISEPQRCLGSAAETVRAYALRRMNHEPVSRILGYRDFWDARFEISPHVLDPRPDTETLIEAVLKYGGDRLCRPSRILDLGVGSGAILCALLRSLPGSLGVGIDLSPQACAIARANLANLGLSDRGHIACGNWTEALSGVFHVIVSNPPYIARGELEKLEREVREHDPRLALDGGEDGLAAYREIIPRLPPLLESDGLVGFELGPGQSEFVGNILRDVGFQDLRVLCDLSGHERIMLASASGSLPVP